MNADDILTLVLHYTKTEGKASGQEERDSLFAKIFAIHALSVSGLLFQTVPPTASEQAAEKEEAHEFADFQRAIHILLAVAAKKNWLRETCAWVLIDVIRRLRAALSAAQEDSFSRAQRDAALDWLTETIFEQSSGAGLTVDKLAVLLVLQYEDEGSSGSALSADASNKKGKGKAATNGKASSHTPKWRELTISPLKNPLVLHPSNVNAISRILTNAQPLDSEEEAAPAGGKGSATTGNWSPTLPLAWTILLDVYFPQAGKASAQGLAPFLDLYSATVESTLFAPSASSERKLWGFHVFHLALPRLITQSAGSLDWNEEKGAVAKIFSPNLMRTWINHLSKRERLLHAAAKRTSEVVRQSLSSSASEASEATRGEAGYAILHHILMSESGNIHFDKLTSSKTAEGILASLPASAAKRFVHFLCEIVRSPKQGGSSLAVDTQRKWALDQLQVAIRQPGLRTEHKTLQEVLLFLAAHGFYQVLAPKKDAELLRDALPQPPFGSRIQEACRTRFLSCVSDLLDLQPTASGSVGARKAAQGRTESGEKYSLKALEIFISLSKDRKHFKALQSTSTALESEAAQATQKKLATLQQQLRKLAKDGKDEEERERVESFTSLLAVAFFFAVKEAPNAPASAEEGEEAESTADALLQPLLNAAEALYNADEALDEDGPSAAEVLVEALVSSVEQPSAMLRSAALDAFGHFTHIVDAAAIRQIAQHFDADEGADAEEGEDEEMADGEEKREKKSKSGKKAVEAEIDDDEEEDLDFSSSETSSDSEEDDDDAAGQSVDPVFRSKIQAALQAANMADPDAEGEDEDEEGEDDDDDDSSVDFSDFDDDQMMELDGKLGEIFRLQQSGKKASQSELTERALSSSGLALIKDSACTDAKAEAIAFQNRLLDLLDLFARKQPGHAALLEVFKPLLAVVKDSQKDEQQLKNKAASLLGNRICKAKEAISAQGEAQEQALDLLEFAQQELRSNAAGADAQYASLCGSVSIYLTKSVLALSSDAPKQLVAIWRETLSDFLTRKQSAVRPAQLNDALQRFAPTLGWSLREDVAVAGCRGGEGVKTFKQMQMFNLAQVVLKGKVQSAVVFSKQSQSQSKEKGGKSKSSGKNKDAQELVEFLPEVAKTVLSVIESACQDQQATAESSPAKGKGKSKDKKGAPKDKQAQQPASAGGLNAAQLKEVLKFTLQSLRITKQTLSLSAPSELAAAEANEQTQRCWQGAERLRKVEELLQASPRFGASPSLKALWKQVLGVAGLAEKEKEKEKEAGAQKQKKQAKEKGEEGESKNRKRKADAAPAAAATATVPEVAATEETATKTKKQKKVQK